MSPLDVPPAPQLLTQQALKAAMPAMAVGSRTTDSGERVLRVRVEQPAADWLHDAVGQINALAYLPAGWNSYGSQVIGAPGALEAVRFLLAHAFPQISPPAIVPTSDGGIQLEWHRSGLDIEIAFGTGDPGFYIEDHEQSLVVEGSLDEAPQAFLTVVPRLREA